MADLERVMHTGTLTGFVSSSYLVRRKDKRIVARSGSCELCAHDLVDIDRCFRHESKVDAVSHVTLGETKYKIVRLDASALYARAEDKSGVMAARTGMHVIINFYDVPEAAAGCAEALASLAEYFKEKGR
eukprot:m.110747 g.110747  ORF g.110747 m.110747 type:complete len:130 (-) comp12901_c0_seq3:6666-7055(-)